MSHKAPEKSVTYCFMCGSTIYWDEEGDPILVRPGNQNLLTCLQHGCSLVTLNAGMEGEFSSNFESLRKGLINVGVSEDSAVSIAAIISTHNVSAATV